jgi:acid phosphatase type 7
MKSYRCFLFSIRFVGLICTFLVMITGCQRAETESDIAFTRQGLTTNYTTTFQKGKNSYTGSADARLLQNAASTNYGSTTTLLADGDEPSFSGKDSYIVLRWDVSSIPSDVAITAAALTVRVTDASTTAYPIYALKRSWMEKGVTWNSALSGTAWQTAGATGSLDRDSTTIGSLSGKSTGSVTASLNSYGVSVVQGWVKNPNQNFGIIVASTTNSDGLTIASSDYATIANRPLLTVTYTQTQTDSGTAGSSGSAGEAGVGGTSTGGTGGGTAGSGGTGGTAGTGGTDGGTAGSGGNTAQLVAVGDIADCATSGVPSSGRTGTALLLGSLPGTVITLGDANNGDGTLSTYNSCFDAAWGRHKSRIRPVPGNHDYFVSNAQGYVDYFTAAIAKPNGTTYYSFDVGSWHAIALDANCSYVSGGCASGSAQEKWLRQDLAAHSSTHCTIAYFHQPRYSSGEHGNNTNTQPLWQALSEYGVEMVLSGHDHVYERFAPMDASGNLLTNGKGIVQFVVGTGGAQLRSFSTTKANSLVRISQTYGVLSLSLRTTGYDWAFIPISGGSASDSGSRECYDP